MRVMSYNIHKGFGGRDRRYRLQRTMDVIAAEQPDLICLQEVDTHVRRSQFDDQPTQFAAAFPSAGVMYQLNVPHKAGGYGNLVLSRWPILAQAQIALTRKRGKPRGAQVALIETPSGPFRLVHWHLSLAERERHWQVRRLLEHQFLALHPNMPTLVIGDTNDWRNTLAKGPFAVHGYTHVTSPPRMFRTFPAYFPLGSLDKAFIRGPITMTSVRVVQTKLCRDASDHLPLMIDFELPEQSTEKLVETPVVSPPA